MTTSVDTESQPGGAAGEPLTVQLSRTVPAPVGKVWGALISTEGTAVWLGDGAVLGGKGESYHCADGSTGVVRSYHPLEQLRVSWHADESAPGSLIEIDLRADGDGTRVDFRQDGLHDAALREDLQQRWADRLDALAAAITG